MESLHPVQQLKCSALLLGLVFSFATSHALAQVRFLDDDFLDLLHRAKQEEKLIFVDAYTDWCGWCKKMDEETFSDSAVGVYMNERFINTRLHMEEGFGMKMAMRHRVSQYPHYLIFDSEGNLLRRLAGYHAPQAFMDQIQGEVYHNDPLPKLSEPLNYDLDYPDFYTNSFKKNKERTYPTAQEVENWLDTREDLTDEVSWSVMHRFVGGGTYALKIAELKDVLYKKYGQSEVTTKLANLIFNDVKAAIKSRDEQGLEHALNACDKYLSTESEDYKLRYKLYYYQMTSDWKSYGNVVDNLIKGGTEDRQGIIFNAATTIESFDADTTTALQAAEWMKILSERTPIYKHKILYAKLLLKSGKTEPARTALLSAVDMASTEENKNEAMRILNQIP